MFCPVCNAEYREGFTVCADCGIKLVSELPLISSEPPYFLLWEGEDPVLHDSLTEELRKERLHYVDTPLDVYRRGSADPLGFKLGPKFGFAVSLHESDRGPAIRILERLLEIEPSESPLESLLPPEPRDLAGEVLRAKAWDSSTPTVALWTGDNSDALEFLENALTGVGVTSRRVGETGASTTLLVRTEDEAVAKEIQRQINENTVAQESAPEPIQSVWYDDPVESYALLWVICAVVFFFGLFFLATSIPVRPGSGLLTFAFGMFSIAASVGQFGTLWMIYQAVRYEVRPFRFVLLAFVPFAFVWYYVERYAKRRAASRLPVAIRMRMHRPAN
jgi:hypothetical protein